MDVAADLKRWAIPFDGEPVLEPLPGDAGARRYVRIRTRPGSSVMLMLVPPEGDSPHSAGAAELPYLNIQRFLKSRGLPVPEVHGWDPSTGRLYHEDFGDVPLSSVLREQPGGAFAAYASAVALLVRMQKATRAPEPSCMAFGRSFGVEAVRRELAEFLEVGLTERIGRPLAPGEIEKADRILDRLASDVASLPACFSHRDFHGDNLLLSPGPRMIDFQDAFLAPRLYDLASLLTDRDSFLMRKGEIPVDALLEEYAEGMDIPLEEADRELWLCALQRQLKLAGRFVSLERKGKAGYRRHLPTVWDSLGILLKRADRGDLKELLASVGGRV